MTRYNFYMSSLLTAVKSDYSTQMILWNTNIRILLVVFWLLKLAFNFNSQFWKLSLHPLILASFFIKTLFEDLWQ